MKLYTKGDRMRKVTAVIAAGIVIGIGSLILPGGKAVGAEQTGEALFKQNCAICHVDGGNIVNAQKPLHKKEREANGVKTAADIIKRMRNPGPGMTMFDEKTISNKDAHKIAEYILKTF
jgi:cytochrome c6